MGSGLESIRCPSYRAGSSVARLVNELFLKLFCGLLDASMRKGGGGSAKSPWKDLMERVDNTKVALSLLQIFEA
jgi:hypothetical protein